MEGNFENLTTIFCHCTTKPLKDSFLYLYYIIIFIFIIYVLFYLYYIIMYIYYLFILYYSKNRALNILFHEKITKGYQKFVKLRKSLHSRPKHMLTNYPFSFFVLPFKIPGYIGSLEQICLDFHGG